MERANFVRNEITEVRPNGWFIECGQRIETLQADLTCFNKACLLEKVFIIGYMTISIIQKLH